jgi:ATP-binding cassette subfamily B protein
VDTKTELLIREALDRLLEGRTSLVIAHRLSTIQHADRILVFHKGRLREQGSHQQLLAQRGIYYRLYQLQYKDQELRASFAETANGSASSGGKWTGFSLS